MLPVLLPLLDLVGFSFNLRGLPLTCGQITSFGLFFLFCLAVPEKTLFRPIQRPFILLVGLFVQTIVPLQ